jgi:hypothetical protein
LAILPSTAQYRRGRSKRDASQIGACTLLAATSRNTYNRDGRFASVERYAGVTTANPVASTAFGYDAAGRLNLIHHLGLAAGSEFEESHSYGYDGANRLTSYANLIDEVLATYGYDARGQITSAEDSNSVLPDEAYDYDDNGNRELVDNVFGADLGYVIGPNNRLVFDGTYTYLYDLEGNRTAKFVDTDEEGDWDVGEAGEAYTWDHRNRLVQVDFKPDGETVDASIAYRYDVFNQLIARLYVNDGGLEEFMLGGGGFEEQMLGGGGFEMLDDPGEEDDPLTVFIYDRGQVVWQFDALVDEGFGLISGNDLSHRYLWGPGVDMLLADEQVSDLASEGEVLWAMADHLGSVRDWVDSEGTVVDHAVSDSFGNRTNADAIDAVFEWTGVYRDRPGSHTPSTGALEAERNG